MEVRKGYKLTEVGVIPSDWDVVEIQDVCKLINGRGFKPFEWRKEGLPIIRIQNLNGSDDFNYYDGPYDRKIEINTGQLLFAWSGSRGTSFGPHIWNGGKGLLNYHTWKINVDETKINRDYFLHSLKELTKKIEESAHGASALVHVQKWQIEKVKFVVTTSQLEQTAIATAISDTDALITSLEKLIAKKRNIKQGAMQELLKPKKGWEVKRLGEVAEIRDGTHQTPNYVEQGVPFYSVESVTSNNFTNTKFITEEEHRFLTKSFKMEKGDILMTRIGSIGDCKLIDWDVNASFYVSLALLKIKKGFSANFIYHYSKSSAFKNEVELNSLQTAIPKKINLGPISSVKIQLPDFVEQNRIGSILSEMEKEIDGLESKLAKYRLIKSGMMQNLLTGKIRLV